MSNSTKVRTTTLVVVRIRIPILLKMRANIQESLWGALACHRFVKAILEKFGSESRDPAGLPLQSDGRPPHSKKTPCTKCPSLLA
jgi:hypothetical protein